MCVFRLLLQTSTSNLLNANQSNVTVYPPPPLFSLPCTHAQNHVPLFVSVFFVSGNTQHRLVCVKCMLLRRMKAVWWSLAETQSSRREFCANPTRHKHNLHAFLIAFSNKFYATSNRINSNGCCHFIDLS